MCCGERGEQARHCASRGGFWEPCLRQAHGICVGRLRLQKRRSRTCSSRWRPPSGRSQSRRPCGRSESARQHVHVHAAREPNDQDPDGVCAVPERKERGPRGHRASEKCMTSLRASNSKTEARFISLSWQGSNTSPRMTTSWRTSLGARARNTAAHPP